MAVRGNSKKPSSAGKGKYIFFIGGSGARAYRAFLHSCAAGVVRESEVRVMLLDADTKNAACAECEELYKLYSAQYEMFQNMAQSRRRQGVTTPAFQCKVVMYHGKVVSPVETNNRWLSHLVPGNHMDGRRALEWFYDETERNQDLFNGFYAHPNIGCLFFQNFDGDGTQSSKIVNDLFKGCLNDIENDLRNGDVEIVIVGSLFGGTGAAGIPTVLKMIQNHCQNKGGDLSRLHFGGVLLAPYFKVPAREDNEGGNNIPIDSDTFLSTTRAALYYYQFQDVFQHIYLIGKEDADLISPLYRDGGREQNNKAHIVELMTVAAAKDFLGNGPLRQNAFDRVSVLMLQSPNGPREDSNQKNRLDWSSECLGRDFWGLADMLRTQMLLETEIYPYSEGKERGKKGTYQWYKAYDIRKYDLENYDDDLTKMRRYTEDFLEWMYDLQHRYADSGDERLERDEGVALCGPTLDEVIELIERRNDSSVTEKEQRHIREALENVLSKFNTTVDTAQNVIYVTSKAFEIFSFLGIVPQPIASLGLAGLFKRLFDLASAKKDT